MNTKEAVIQAAKQGFEARFAEKTFYNKQTQDAAHLKAILDFLPFRQPMRILDFGTGSGYLAFAIAEQHPQIAVTGVDITGKALEQNRRRAAAEQRKNLQFICYDGIRLPFEDTAFNLVVSRYVLHHLPDIEAGIAEICRVLKPSGSFFLSDPAPNPDDTAGFIDAYMQVRRDGHIRFYSSQDWIRICSTCGLQFTDAFSSSIRFPRTYEPVYQEICSRYAPEIAAGYDLQITGNEIYVTEQVNNMLFRKP